MSGCPIEFCGRLIVGFETLAEGFIFAVEKLPMNGSSLKCKTIDRVSRSLKLE